ncbi:MAG: LacI family DNA-binding transcriptional regulator [Verrucomicrobiota bacterium]
MKNRPTMQTIADVAGVSKNTVSCALRNKSHISKQTRARIRQIADELGYRPNPMISAFMQSIRQNHPPAKTSNLAWIHDLSEPDEWRERNFYKQLHGGAKQQSHAQGYNLIPAWYGEPGMTGAQLSRILRNQGVDGIVVAPLSSNKTMETIQWEWFAASSMGFTLKSPLLHRAATFFHHTIPKAVEKLHEHRYKRVGILLCKSADIRSEYSLQSGCVIAQKRFSETDHSIPVLERQTLTPVQVKSWITAKKLDAVVDAGFNLTRHFLEQINIPIPGKLGVVSITSDFDDFWQATIQRDWKGIGSAAVDLVVNQLQNNQRGIPSKSKTVLIEAEWVSGKTVRAIE